MITKENLDLFFNKLTEDQINLVIDSPEDYVGAYITGNHGTCIIEPIENHLNEESEEIRAAGGFVTDKDGFLQLFVESGSHNEYLKKHI